MNFIADAMLGSLAKRLRLRGHDVLYDPSWDDNEIIRLALSQNRAILTRDTGLAKRPLAANHVLIESNRVEDQLRQLERVLLHDAPAVALTRCSRCNELLTPVSRESVRDLVPDHIRKTHTAFQRCPGCGRIYWQGTHVERMKRKTGTK